MPASPSTTCCEAAPRSGPDASSAPAAASLCCAPYESRLLAPGRAELNAALGMYSAPYAAGQGYGNYLPYGAEPAALYTALVSARPPGSAPEGRGVQQAGETSCFALGVGAGTAEGRGTGSGAGPSGVGESEGNRLPRGAGAAGRGGVPVLLDAKRCRFPCRTPSMKSKTAPARCTRESRSPLPTTPTIIPWGSTSTTGKTPLISARQH